MSVEEPDESDLRVPVSGVFSMPAVEGESEDQCLLTLADMQKELPTLTGAPVRVEHGEEVVGTVEKVTIDAQNRIAGTVRLNRDYSGRKALSACRDGRYKGFSLGIMHEPGLGDDGKPIIKNKLILHVALAQNPEFSDHTKISDIGDDRREVKIGRRFVKIAAEKLRRETGTGGEKQTAPRTLKSGSAKASTADKTRQQPITVSLSSNSSAPETQTMSSVEELNRQMAELQKQRDALEAQQKAEAEASMKVDQQQQQQPPQQPPQQDFQGWSQKQPNPYTSPVVFNMNVGGAQAPGTDPLSQMSEATAAEFERQKADAEAYRKMKAEEERRNRKGEKRSRDEAEAPDQPSTTAAASLIPEQDEKDREIARLKALLGEAGEGKERRQEDNEGTVDHASSKTQALVDSIQSKLAQATTNESAAADMDEDADIDDKLIAKQKAEAASATQDIDASKISFDDLSKENETIRTTIREVNALKSEIKKMKDGAAKQHKKDELARKERLVRSASESYVRRNNAWLVRQMSLAGQDIDDDMSSAMADYATQPESLTLKDLASLNNMGRLVTVSHANAQNGLMATQAALAKERQVWEKERLKLQAKAESERIAAERAQAHLSIANSDPRFGVRGANPVPQGRRHSQPKSAPQAQARASVDPRFAYMKQTGIPMRLVDASKRVDGMKVFESGKAVRDLSFVPAQSRHSFRPPRARFGLQRNGEIDVLKELDRVRRSHPVGQNEMLTPSDFSSNCMPVAPPGSQTVDGFPGLARLPQM